MKRIAIALFLFAVLLFAGPELVTNGGFDSDTTGWSPFNDAVLASVSGGVSGNCLSVTENGTNQPRAQNTSAIVTSGGETLDFTVYIKAGTEIKYRVYVLDNVNSTLQGDSGWTDCVGAGWNRHSAQFTLAGNCTSVFIRLISYADPASGDAIYFDSVSLKEVDSGAIVFGCNWE